MMGEIFKHEYQLRDLPTRAVTLFPTKAHVVRDVKNVALKPGVNQVIIVGLTPTTDEHSIKVEGTGSAIISDISVKLVPNQDIFEEIYPETDDEVSETEDDDKDRSTEEAPKIIELRKEKDQLSASIDTLEDDMKRAVEGRANADHRLTILDRFGNNFEPKNGEEIEDFLKTYSAQRAVIFGDHVEGSDRERELKKEIIELRSSLNKVDREIHKQRRILAKEKREVERAKAKAKALDYKRRAKKQQEKARIRQEREKFWPRSCYTVCITLDSTQYTPVSSRRSSVSSQSDLVKPALQKPRERVANEDEPFTASCDLSLSYVTSSACWSPCYDMKLNTTSVSGTVMFDAELTNTTSEAWRDCKITLSTSQAVFTGLQDTVPKLNPWRIKLLGKGSANDSEIMDSREERQALGKHFHQNAVQWNNPALRAKMFGISPEIPTAAGGLFGGLGKENLAAKASNNLMHQLGRSSLFGQKTDSGDGHSRSQPVPPPPPVGMSNAPIVGAAPPNIQAFGQPSQHASALFAENISSEQPEADLATLMDPEPSQELSFQESAMEETGMTTTYDLPGVKSLHPSFTASKQRVAQISLSSVTLSHIVVAKLRPAAFLQARLRNSSRTPLLRGPVGLTLDGSFMGRSTLPRCSPGESFTLGLGIDPAVRVTYSKVDVRRGTTGVFTADTKMAFKRAVTIVNTRAASGGAEGRSQNASDDNKAVRLTVIDQVPVSENEPMKVELVQPRGLSLGGTGVSTGERADGKEGKDWGKAVAVMKEGGQINWDVTLHAGKGVKLPLEYNVSLPAGLRAVQADVWGGESSSVPRNNKLTAIR